MNLSATILTPHARDQLLARGLDEAAVRQTLELPDEVAPVRPGRVVAQRIFGGHLLRVFVDIGPNPPEVVTAYKTSKLDKYRRTP